MTNFVAAEKNFGSNPIQNNGLEPAMAPDQATTKRRGGRSARHELRAAPPTAELRAVRPGLEGGLYKPLTDAEVQRIHHAALDVLEQVGFDRAIPSCIELVTGAGGSLTEDGRLLFPRGLVEDMLAVAGRNFTLHGRDPAHDMEPSGKRVYFGTGGAAVHMVDALSGEYRESTLADLYDVGRIVDCMDNIHFFQRSVVARDMTDNRDLDINTCYAAIAATQKHIGTSWVSPDHVDETLAMLHMVAGGEAEWRARPFVSMSSCYVVPPLKFAEETCECMEAAVRGGMPVLLLSAGQAGATAPAPLAGAVVQCVAEVLAAVVYVNLLSPGHPCMMGAWPFVSDLRTGMLSAGSGEQSLLSSACAQMLNFYDLTGSVAAGMTDSKVPDAQSGYEKGYTASLVGNSGANLIYESAGMHASLLGFCPESLVIDNDMLGGVLRSVRGIEVTDDSLSVETIRQVCLDGPGHFLSHDQTMQRMQSDFEYPTVGDRTSPKEWVEIGSTDVVQKARDRVAEILSTHYPEHIAPELDAEIRERFDIKLPRERMRP